MKQQAFNPYLPSWEYIPDGRQFLLFTGEIKIQAWLLLKC